MKVAYDTMLTGHIGFKKKRDWILLLVSNPQEYREILQFA